MIDLLPPAQVTAPGQVIQPQSVPSLIASLMHPSSMPQPAGGASVPLSSMMEALKKMDPDELQRLWSGLGNWTRGDAFDGMAAGSNLGALSGSAAGNIAGGAAGL